MRLQQAAAALALVFAVSCSGGDDDASEPVDESTTTTVPVTVHRLDDALRLHQVQTLGSHNSYHVQPPPEVLAAIAGVNAASAAGLEYGHRPLPEQFDELGVRQIELDVYADPDGGRYADPGLLTTLGLAGETDPRLLEPGYKVIHQASIDTQATCPTLTSCLEEIDSWSAANPGHLPIMVLLEMKDVEVTPAMFDALDAEIRAVLDPERLVTPDDVRGEFATLGEAVRTDGWPTLGAVRGKVMFGLDNGGLRDVYRTNAPSLEGRVLFTPSSPGEPDAAFAKLNNPVDDADAIRAALDANMLVRTRADADTIQSRSNDTTMRDAALASGAQFVSTDYMEPDTDFSDYTVEIPGGTPARCNPVTAPRDCVPTDVEDPERL
ncbi:MAG: phosphatidylinositol-specific phospholipase C1-like protein [Actinomycetota bacterium]|nr:phosphatidylinositol-specific phospholipase C1-like protein [Actinomycetota bacterium]